MTPPAPADPSAIPPNPAGPRRRLMRLIRGLVGGAAGSGPSPKKIEGGLIRRMAARALAATVPTNRSGNNASVR